MRLDAQPVLVLDAQATGASPRHGSLLELGWVVASASAPAPAPFSTWLELPAGEHVSRVVRKLTGYRDVDADAAMAPEAAWRALGLVTRDIGASPTPTVIHFARFELAFLGDWNDRFANAAPLPFDAVCLHALAQRLYPELPRSGLRALAGYLGHSTSLERRAAGHVAASAHVWSRMVAELGARGIEDWSALRGFLAAPAPKKGRRVFPMPSEARRALPDRPGVYRFQRSNGDVLYVGKATSLKKRVAGHFSAASRAADRNQEMLTQALAIEHTVTASPLEAALLECDEIKRVDPPYNVQLRETTRVALFASRDLLDLSEAPDEAHPWGPLPSRFGPTALGAVRRLAEGARPDERLRARAVGVPPAFAPDEAMFLEAWVTFATRHLTLPARTPWGRVVRATTRLALLLRADGLEPRDDEAPPGWDPSRIVRYLERSVLVGGQLLRRARWLTSLCDSALAYAEAGAWRKATIERGVIGRFEDAGGTTPFADPPPWRPWRERQRSFDGASYDRLRVLTTELRRVLDEGGDARLVIQGGRVLGRDALALWLRFV